MSVKTMKKLINSPDAVVREALEGMEAAHGDLIRVNYDPAYVVRTDAPVEGKVGIISGGGAGLLHIVKNYTGDVLNFEMAADLAKSEGIDVEAVVTNDDVAVQDSLYTAGRRGVGITVIAEKICGAAAEEK